MYSFAGKMAPKGLNELEELELLSLQNSITKELINHTGLNDPTLAEFLLHLHSEAPDLAQFKVACKGVGAEFPDSFLVSVDRLILAMHPKYKPKKQSKKKQAKAKAQRDPVVLSEDKQRQIRLFPGLALADSEWQPSFKVDPAGLPKGAGLDPRLDEVDLLAEFEGVHKRGNIATIPEEDENDGGARKRMRGRSPDYQQQQGAQGGYGSRGGDERGREGYGRRDGGYGNPSNGGGRRQLDDKPILYKVYPGKVAGIKDFGAFVSLEGISGRAEGSSRLRYSVL